ncbi:hypothetical protein D9758_014128 [Tetrapyrgos nigripes]|uniref:DUF6534 domain-containing protein n=1 Tax=Tetrapyrgos nigripes TaxID=182062 RepID=A0A8H5FPK7_9AGAR|nr:hypothetical protein D9758_014128 [Tetrapyrgos nigripes]
MSVEGFKAMSYGALLLGGLMAYSFSGIVAVQSVVYFKLYPKDIGLLKALVSTVWILDLAHSAFIGFSLFYYFVTSWAVDSTIDDIAWSVALSVITTALQTVIAHCFFAHKIYRSSQKNLLLVVPILVLAFCRLIAASGTHPVQISATIRLKISSPSYDSYYSGNGPCQALLGLHADVPGGRFLPPYTRNAKLKYHCGSQWIFTTGLSLSSATDILIALSLFFLLQSMRKRIGTESSVMVQVVDTLTLYTLETGLLTCVLTTASLICWLIMPTNLVFLGLHFVIAKLYANSLLASLNTRKQLREMGPRISPWSDKTLPILSAEDFHVANSDMLQSPLSRNRDSIASLMSTNDRFTRPPMSIKSRQAVGFHYSRGLAFEMLTSSTSSGFD